MYYEVWNAGHFLVFKTRRTFPRQTKVCCRIICTKVYTSFYLGMLDEALLSGQLVGAALNLGFQPLRNPLGRGRAR